MHPIRAILAMILIGLAMVASAQSGGRLPSARERPSVPVTGKEFNRMLEAARTGNGYVCNPFGDFSICSCTGGALPGTPPLLRGHE